MFSIFTGIYINRNTLFGGKKPLGKNIENEYLGEEKN